MKLLGGWSCPFTELSQPTGTDANDMSASKLRTEAARALPIRTAK